MRRSPAYSREEVDLTGFFDAGTNSLGRNDPIDRDGDASPQFVVVAEPGLHAGVVLLQPGDHLTHGLALGVDLVLPACQIAHGRRYPHSRH